MKAVPGGQLPIEDIFGRDPFIATLWRVLETNSVRMEAERRIGKTSILHKMAAEPPVGWVAVSLDVEKVHSAAEFAEVVCQEVHQRIAGWGMHGRRLQNFLGMFSGGKLGPITFPDKKTRPEGYWKTLLTSTIEDLVEHQATAGKRVVFLFDEMPLMLTSIAHPERDGPQTAMEILDVLRHLRQDRTTGRGFRMILCGSIGLHHILDTLKRQGYTNRPVNDMQLVEVLPLDLTVATDLAARLLAGEGMAGDPAAPALIATLTGGFPYYIHWVVSELRMGGKPVTPSEIDSVVNKLLVSEHDPCDFQHFSNRIDDYYPKEGKTVKAILDHAAKSSDPLGQAELINVAKTAGAVEDERIRDLLRLLALDHYLERDSVGRYAFRHTLLRRWWCIKRELSA